MRARLLQLAALLAAVAGGTVVFVNWDTGSVDRMADGFGALEVVDRSQCSSAACNTTQCQVAQNHFDDGGTGCTPRFIECPVRIGPRIRNVAADAGVVFGPQKYQRIRLIAARCPASGGGFALGIPTDDNGWPIFAVAPNVTPGCVRAPVGNVTCLRDPPGPEPARFFGELNVFPAAEATGTGCQPVECAVFYGDDPAADL